MSLPFPFVLFPFFFFIVPSKRTWAFKSLRLFYNYHDTTTPLRVVTKNPKDIETRQEGMVKHFLDVVFSRAFIAESVLSHDTRTMDVPSYFTSMLDVEEPDVRHCVPDLDKQEKMVDIYQTLKEHAESTIQFLGARPKISKVAKMLMLDILKGKYTVPYYYFIILDWKIPSLILV